MSLRVLGWATAALLYGTAAWANVLVLQVSDVTGEPLRGIQIGILGGHKDVTDDYGTCRLRLPLGVGVGGSVDLQLGAQDGEPGERWVFIDPWLSSRVDVPAGVRRVVLGRRGDRQLLESEEVLVTFLSRLMTQMREQLQPVAEGADDLESRRQLLREEIAAALGLSVEDLDRAVRENFAEAEDPQQRGSLAFYEANYEAAEAEFRLARKAARAKIEEGFQELAIADLRLGQTLLAQGRYGEALAQLEEARELEPGDPAVGWALGEAFFRVGRFAEAERVFRERFEATRALGEENPESLIAMNNLAVTLMEQGDFSGARELQERVLEVRRRVLGEEHPDTLLVIGNLANTLKSQGDLSAARELEERVLETHRRVRGEGDPSTLTAMHNLAATLQDQGDLAGSRRLVERVLAVRLERLGEEHLDTARTMANLAVTLRFQGDLSRARGLQERVLAVYRRVLGEEHPATLTTMGNLAGTMREQGDLADSRKLAERVWEGRRRVLGEAHPDTLLAMETLAVTLSSQDDLAAAQALKERLLEARRRVLGEEHPTTLVTMESLAMTLSSQRDFSDARVLQEHVLEVRRRVLGETHPSTTDSRWALFITLLELEEAEPARELLPELCALTHSHRERLTEGEQFIAHKLSEIGICPTPP